MGKQNRATVWRLPCRGLLFSLFVRDHYVMDIDIDNVMSISRWDVGIACGTRSGASPRPDTRTAGQNKNSTLPNGRTWTNRDTDTTKCPTPPLSIEFRQAPPHLHCHRSSSKFDPMAACDACKGESVVIQVPPSAAPSTAHCRTSAKFNPH